MLQQEIYILTWDVTANPFETTRLTFSIGSDLQLCRNVATHRADPACSCCDWPAQYLFSSSYMCPVTEVKLAPHTIHWYTMT